MPIKRAAKKKLGGRGSLGGGHGSSSREYSDKRPNHVMKLAPCMHTCPQGTPVREAINTISLHEKHGLTLDEAFTKAWETWTDVNPFPAILGRVCPHPCEGDCNRTNKDGAVAVNQIERFIGDWGLDKNLALKKDDDAQDFSEKVAIVGSGPAGMNAAYYLARKGYKVTVYEAFAKAGGMLRYGIPDYRLPQNLLDKEIQRILDLGVELKTNTMVGKDIPFADIEKQYDAVFVGIGAHQGRLLGLEGEEMATNVYTGTQFLNMVNSGNPPEVGKKVVVVGGGDSAMDAARVCLRLGAEVTLLYRRTRNEMPAIEEDIVGGEKEGINFIFLATPVGLKIEEDKCTSIKCQKMELGEPDESGRRRPVPIDEFFDLEIDTLIPSISQEPNFEGLEDLKAGPRDWIKADEFMEQDEEHHHYAGGDALNLGLVTIAMAQGKRAAATIHARFRGLKVELEERPPLVEQEKILTDYFEAKPRTETEEAEVKERVKSLVQEVHRTMTEDEVVAEANRCLSCGMCIECGQCWTYCQDQVVQRPAKPGSPFTFKLDLCKGCEKCAEVCPCGYIEMK